MKLFFLVASVILLLLPLIFLLRMKKVVFAKKATIFIFVFLLAGLVVLVFSYIRETEQRSIKETFSRLAAYKFNAIQVHIHTYREILHSVERFYEASRFVDRKEFQVFVEEVILQHKSIKALKWVPRVPYGEKETYENLARKEGYSNFHFIETFDKREPVKKRKEYFPVYYVEPYDGNEKNLGVDLTSYPEQFEAIRKARDSGHQVATGRVLLDEKEEHSYGFLVFDPVYEKEKPLSTVDERRGALKGFLLGVFHINDLVYAVMNQLSSENMNLHIYINDENKEGGKITLYGSGNKGVLFSYKNLLEVAGQEWTLEFTPTPFFIQENNKWQAWALLIGGLFFVAFLQVFLLVIINRTNVIKRLVDEQTLEIRQSKIDIEKAIEKLSESNTELERFAYVASHDLQEPLRTVISFTGLLKKEYGKDFDDRALKYIDFSVQSAKRMKVLIEDLLNYSRVQQEDEKFTLVDSNQALKEALNNLTSIIDEKKVKVTYDKLPMILGSSIRMTRLLQNLIGNGIKYVKSDTIPVIHVGIEERPLDWLFSIKDNGIGIKKENLEKIFMPFKRLHLRSKYSGTGIGLTVCKKIVEQFGGHIWVQSKPNQGSTFYFTLPKSQDVKRVS